MYLHSNVNVFRKKYTNKVRIFIGLWQLCRKKAWRELLGLRALRTLFSRDPAISPPWKVRITTGFCTTPLLEWVLYAILLSAGDIIRLFLAIMAKAYKENKFDFRPFAPNTAVDIQIPSDENDQRQARFTIASGFPRETPQIKDEDDYAKRFLATQGSLYFRQRKVYPRTFLWRVVNDNKILEIQAADLTRSSHDQHEAGILLRLEFQDGIIPSGVALADAEDHEVLNVFVLTKTNRLHTLSLRPEFFRRAASIDENITDWCRSCTPAPLSFAHPHRLHASNTTELFISLDSGALLRLTRRAGDDGEL
jgi:hypothetical protein